MSKYVRKVPEIIEAEQITEEKYDYKYAYPMVGDYMIVDENKKVSFIKKSSKNTPTSNFVYEIKWWDELLVIFISNKG